MMMSDQYRSLREGAGLVDRSDRGRIVVEGQDRAAYLQGLLTNDIEALTEGAGCYAAYLTPQGRMLADVEVMNTGDRLLLDVHISVKDMFLERLTELIFTEDVRVTDWTSTWSGYIVAGPSAGRFVTEAIARLSAGRQTISPTLDAHECRVTSFGDASLVLARTDPCGGYGLDLWVEQSSATRVRRALLDVGCVDVDCATAEVVRVESGRPAFPVDMTTDTIPLEAGIEARALSETKGCYVGQEVIVRIQHRGQGRVARRLMGIKMEQLAAPSPRPPPGATLWQDGDQVGHLTSVVFSPSLGVVIALGYVARELTEPGTVLAVELGQTRVPAVVTALPFAGASPN